MGSAIDLIITRCSPMLKSLMLIPILSKTKSVPSFIILGCKQIYKGI